MLTYIIFASLFIKKRDQYLHSHAVCPNSFVHTVYVDFSNVV